MYKLLYITNNNVYLLNKIIVAGLK